MRQASATLLLGLLSLAVGCRRPALSTGISVESSLQKLIPADTRVLAGVDLDRLKTTPFYARHAQQLDIPALAALSEQTGFDPRRDLSAVVLAWNGKDLLIAGRGKLSREALERRLASANPPALHRKHKLFRVGGSSLSLIDEHTFVAGSPRSVETAIDQLVSGGGEIPDELASRLRSLPRDNQVWLVSRGDLPFADLPLRSDYASALSNLAGYVNGTSAGAAVADGLRLGATIFCVSEVGSKRVNDALRGGIGLARLSTKDNQLDILRLYDAIKVVQGKQQVDVTANLSPDLSDLLLTRLTGLSGRAGSLLRPH